MAKKSRTPAAKKTDSKRTASKKSASTKPMAARSTPIYSRIREILESARTNIARSVNTTQVVTNWLIGREIVEEEQRGNERADYGNTLVDGLSRQLQQEYGKGYSSPNLWLFRQFFVGFPKLVGGEILYAARRESTADRGIVEDGSGEILDAARQKSQPSTSNSLIPHAARSESWQPGQLHPNLSWTHYRTLLRVEKSEARSFYEIESLQNNWSARELERQINSLLFERLALSRDKKGLMQLATKGQEITKPDDIFKDPVVIEFLGLPESPKLVESDLETALLDNLQAFLLELGKGFAFVARQERITLDGDHFYIDLVFYHIILKCFVLIDLKVDKLSHADLGQLQLYVNYFDEERRSAGDNPTLGLILCTDKNDAVVKYTLGAEQSQKIFTSRYKLHLPTEAELLAELRREIRLLPAASSTTSAKKKTRKKL